jgi:hypothetical protein
VAAVPIASQTKKKKKQKKKQTLVKDEWPGKKLSYNEHK